MERYLRVNLLGPSPRLIKREFTGPRSYRGWETLPYCIQYTRGSAEYQVTHLTIA